MQQPNESVRLLRAWRNYNKGEVASFPRDMVAGLVQRKLGERVAPRVVADPSARAPASKHATVPAGTVTK